MTRLEVARGIMSFVLLVGSILSFILDWSPNHLLNPAWHPHARFHGALMLFLLAGVSLTGLWLLWRGGREPEIAISEAKAYVAGALKASRPLGRGRGPLDHFYRFR